LWRNGHEEVYMRKAYTVTESALVEAPPNVVYWILSDYHEQLNDFALRRRAAPAAQLHA